VQVEKRQPGSIGVPIPGVSKNLLWTCSPLYVARVEKIYFAKLMKGFSWRNLEGVKKKEQQQKSLLFETFLLINLKYESSS